MNESLAAGKPEKTDAEVAAQIQRIAVGIGERATKATNEEWALNAYDPGDLQDLGTSTGRHTMDIRREDDQGNPVSTRFEVGDKYKHVDLSRSQSKNRSRTQGITDRSINIHVQPNLKTGVPELRNARFNARGQDPAMVDGKMSIDLTKAQTISSAANILSSMRGGVASKEAAVNKARQASREKIRDQHVEELIKAG